MNIRLFLAIAEYVMLLALIAIVITGTFYIFQSGDGIQGLTQRILDGLSMRGA
mgnify:CR=1 FL=1